MKKTVSSPSDIVDIIKRYDKILIAAHANPDGDAVGSCSAMGYILKALNKEFCIYNPTGFPPHLTWVNVPSVVRTSLFNLPFKPQLVICLDCGDSWRLGNDLAERLGSFNSINIDHHLENPMFGSLGNLVCTDFAATGQIVASIADAAQVELTGGLAEGIYLSLISDTGSFSFGNTSYHVMELAARLSKLGLDIPSLREKMDSQWTMAKVRLWGQLFNRMYLTSHGQIAIAVVQTADFMSTGALKSDLEQFVEHMRCISGVRVALLVREDYPQKIKISLRSRGNDDVRSISARFGGGGHKNAAGATMDMDVQDAVPLLIELIKQNLCEA